MNDEFFRQNDNPNSTRDVMLDERQQREHDYHVEFAGRNRDKVNRPVPLDVIAPGPRRPWNAHWTAYDFLMADGLVGKRVMVPGCGFGDDAIRLAKLGSDVYSFDLTRDVVEIGRLRALRMDVSRINFEVMAAETLTYPDNFFDVIFFNDILHHVDISRAVAEAQRVLKPDGRIVANELYTHSALQHIRESRFVSSFVWPRMVRFIYGTDTPYITQDEHKIDERELSILRAILRGGSSRRYFLFLGGRILPADWRWVASFDRAFFAMAGSAAEIFAVVSRRVV